MRTDEPLAEKLEGKYQEFVKNQTTDNKNALLNVMLDVCSIYVQEADFEGFEKTFTTIRRITDLKEDQTTSEKISEYFPKLTSKIADKIFENLEILDRIYNMILELKVRKPGTYYSNFYLSVHRFRKIWKGYIEFCRWWGFENFTNYDFCKQDEGENKVLRMSLAEAALIGYTKRLEKTNFKEDLAKLAMTFISFSQKYKMTVYANYYIAKILIKLKINRLYIRRILKTYIIEKHSKPWSWGILAQTFQIEEPSEKYSCLLMALHYSKDFEEKIFGNIYFEIAVMFYELGNYGESKFMMERYLKSGRAKRNQIIIDKITQNQLYKESNAVRPKTDFDYMENCRKIVRGIENPDKELWIKIYKFLRENFKESIMWSKDWYQTM